MGQIYCPLWATWEDPVRSRPKLWESGGGWPLWADGNTKDMDEPVPSANQHLAWEVYLYSDWYAGNVTPREEIRVKEPHWNIGSCLQLHPQLSYRVQPLLSHVWKTTSPSNSCYTWLSTTYNNSTKHLKIHTKNERVSKPGSEEGWSLPG